MACSVFYSSPGGALTGQLGSGTPEGMTEAPALMEDRSGRVDERALPPLRVQGNPELRPLPPLIRTREGRAFSELSDVSDIAANENAAEDGGGVMFSLSKTKIERLSSIKRPSALIRGAN